MLLRKVRLSLVLISLTVAIFLLYQTAAPALAVNPAGRELIRLHIIAHSDHPQDQAIKLKVRDAIIKETAYLFSNATTEQEAQRLLVDHLDEVESIANRTLAESGASYFSKTELGIYPFPERTYENLTLPKGYYRALKVVLGDGQGCNWWCVLFPPLCFVNGSSGQQVTPVTKMQGEMTEETQRVMAAGKTQLPEPSTSDDKIEVRFKAAEVWAKMRPRARALLSWQQEK